MLIGKKNHLNQKSSVIEFASSFSFILVTAYLSFLATSIKVHSFVMKQKSELRLLEKELKLVYP